MTQKLKALGLALVAACALSAVAASGASAQELHLDTTTHLTADQHEKNILHTGVSGNIQCETVTGSGTFSGTTIAEVSVENVAYSGCVAFGQTTHIDMMGCSYTITGINATTGELHIVCPTTSGGVTDEITVTPTQGGVAICHVNVPEQTLKLSITNTGATGAGTPEDIDIRPEESIKYSSLRTAGGAKCPATGSYTDGNYTNYLTITGFDDAGYTERVGITYT